MRNIFVVIIFFLICFINVYPQKKVEGELQKTINEWVEGFNSGDINKAISIYAEDFIGYYPGQKDQGIIDISEQYKHLFGDNSMSVKIDFTTEEINIAGKYAFVRMILHASIKPKNLPQPIQASDKGLQIWRKEKPGSWKLIRSSTFPVSEPKIEKRQPGQ